MLAMDAPDHISSWADALAAGAAVQPAPAGLSGPPAGPLMGSSSSSSSSSTYSSDSARSSPLEEEEEELNDDAFMANLFRAPLVEVPAGMQCSAAFAVAADRACAPEEFPAAASAASPRGGARTKRKAAAAAAEAAGATAKRQAVNSEVARRYKLSQQFMQLARVARADDTTQAGVLQAAVKTLREYERRVAELTVEVRAAASRSPAAERRWRQRQLCTPLPYAKPGWGGAALELTEFMDASAPISVSLASGKIVDANESYASLVKNDRAVLINGMSVFTLSHPDFTARCYEAVRRLVSGESAVEKDRAKLVSGEGEVLTPRFVAWAVRGADKRPKFIVTMLTPDNEAPPA